MFFLAKKKNEDSVVRLKADALNFHEVSQLTAGFGDLNWTIIEKHGGCINQESTFPLQLLLSLEFDQLVGGLPIDPVGIGHMDVKPRT